MQRKYILIAILFLIISIRIYLNKNVLYAADQNNIQTESGDYEDFAGDYDSGFNDNIFVFKLGGQLKELFTYTKTDQYSEYQIIPDKQGKEKKLIADVKRLRLSPEIDLSDYVHIRVDYDNEIITGSFLKSREFDAYWRDSGYNDLLDMTAEPVYDRDMLYRTKLHRAYAKIMAGDLTVTLGRQQIRFGSGRLWNPLDILNPVSPTFVEGAEEQKGTDALRLEYFLTSTAELSLIYDQKRMDNNSDLKKLNRKNSNVLGRVKLTVAETDIAALGGRVSERNVGGADIAAIFLDGLLRGSFLYSAPEQGDPFLQGSAGYEYNFRTGLYFLLEYFYNQNGLNYNDDLNRAYEESFYSGISEKNYNILSNQLITYNQHYSGIVLGYNITPLLRIECFSIYDYQGRGVFIMPSVKYNPFQNIDITIGTMLSKIFEGSQRESDFEYLEKYGYIFASLTLYF